MCNLRLKVSVSLQEGCEKTNKITTRYDFAVQKEHLFLGNIYSDADLKKSENISTFKNYYIAFDYFLHVAILLNNYYHKNSDIGNVNHGVMAAFLDEILNLKCNFFLELYQKIEDVHLKSTNLGRKRNYQDKNINKNMGFAYTNIIKFPKDDLINNGIFSSLFIENVCNINFGREVIHHSHISSKIISYAHDFCNQKVRENRN